ncbi:MAG: hypothetical protein ACM337_09445, partial [Syntrophaceae bacterium]
MFLWNASWIAVPMTPVFYIVYRACRAATPNLSPCHALLPEAKEGGNMTLTIEVRAKSGKINELYQTL